MRPQIVDVAVGCGQVELAVVVDVEEAGSEAEHVSACSGQPHGRGAVGELATSEVSVEGCRLPIKICDRQVDPAVAVKVATGDTHASQIAAVGVGGDTGFHADLAKSETSFVVEQIIGR